MKMVTRNLVPGITRTSLWNAWKAVRKEVRRLTYRDATDFLEYDIDPDVWINRLLKRINDGSYEPESPQRHWVAKSRGFSRQLTLPLIPDLVLYRAIVDSIYVRAKRFQCKHVYFAQSTLSKVVREVDGAARQRMAKAAPDYESSPSVFMKWLEYDQYRKHLLLNRIYPYIVISDITNFFDSVLYSQVEQRLFGLDVPSPMAGLLFFLLERLSPRDYYTQSPRIGLPVDSFECSRTLAHIVLYPHDDRMVSEVGEDAYVRWMDDQNIGVNSRSEGLKLLASIGKSLSRIHLTPNAGKSRVMSLKEASAFFHFATNKKLDKAGELKTGTARERNILKRALSKIWGRARRQEGHGHWDKILKRVYRLAASCGLRMLRRRGIADILKYPALAGRISDYMRVTGTPRKYLKFVETVLQHKEQVYADVNVVLIESLLRVGPQKVDALKLRSLGMDLIRGKGGLVGSHDAASLAPLFILRYGDLRTASVLRTYLQVDREGASRSLTKTCGLVYSGYGGIALQVVRKAASRLMRNTLGDVVRMIERIKKYDEVPNRLKNRLRVSEDSISRKPFVEMRAIVTARLLSLNSHPRVNAWLGEFKRNILSQKLSAFDAAMIKRLL